MFGIGGSSSKQSSEAESLATSGSTSTSSGSSVAGNVSGSQSGQDIAFKDIFGKLYGGAAQTAGTITGKQTENAAQRLFSGGMGFLDTLQGSAGTDYLSSRLSGDNPVLQEQISGLSEDLGKFFRDELNPAIGSAASGGGQLGGGRQGVAQAGAAGEVATQLSRGITGLRSADIAARDAAAKDLTSLEQGAAGIGLQALPSLLGIKQTGELAKMLPHQALAGIVGGPTTLTESSSYGAGFSTSDQVAEAMSESYSTSKSKSKGKSKSGSIGF